MGYDTYCFICGCCFYKKGTSKENPLIKKKIKIEY